MTTDSHRRRLPAAGAPGPPLLPAGCTGSGATAGFAIDSSWHE